MSAILEAPKPDFNHTALKIERANSHIAHFDAEARRFFARHPYDVSFQPYLKRRRYGYGLFARRPFPELAFALIVGDAIHNLRTALDYLVSACALANGKTITDTQFPIVRTKADLEGRLKEKARKAGPIAMQLIRELKPYPRGNRSLFVIHELDLTDKHRLLQPVACTVEATVTSGGWNALPHQDFTGSLHSARHKGQFIPVAEGYEAAIPTEMSFTGEIVFAPDSPLAGKPCVLELYKLSDAVTEAMSKFETAFGCPKFSGARLRH